MSGLTVPIIKTVIFGLEFTLSLWETILDQVFQYKIWTSVKRPERWLSSKTNLALFCNIVALILGYNLVALILG